MKKSIFDRIFPVPLDYLFLLLGLFFGLLFVFHNPPWQTNDEDRHYYQAFAMSEFQFVPKRVGDIDGSRLPKNLVTLTQSFQGMQFEKGMKISERNMKAYEKTPLKPKDREPNANPQLRTNPIPLIPQAVGIMVGRLINSNPIWLLWFGRIAGLIAFLVLVFYAIRITPVFKSFFFLFGMTPMVLYQAASVTYDSLSNALSFLLVALFLYYALKKDKLERRDYILIIVLTIFHRFAKEGYVLIPFLFFLIPMGKLGNKKKAFIVYDLMLIYFIFLYYLPNFTWQQIIASLHLQVGPNLKKDFVHGFTENVRLTLSEPFTAIKNIVVSTLFQRQDWVGGVIGRFGYSYKMMPKMFFIIQGLALIVVAFFDSKENFILSLKQKLLIFIVGFGTIGLIILGMYLNSPIGASNVFGLQGRYFIPAIPIVFLLLYNNLFYNKNWYRWRGVVLGVYTILTLTYTIMYLDDFFYMP